MEAKDQAISKLLRHFIGIPIAELKMIPDTHKR